MASIETLTAKIDLEYSQDDKVYFLQEYKLDGQGTSRISRSYKGKARLLKLWHSHTLQWNAWI